MKKKCILFPCDTEVEPLVKYCDMMKYDVTSILSLESWNLTEKIFLDKTCKKLDRDNLSFKGIDVLVIIESNSYLDFTAQIFPMIEKAAKDGVDVLIARDISLMEKELCQKCCEANNVSFTELEIKCDIDKLEKLSEDDKINTPILLVAGTSANTQKFDIQLALRKKFLEAGYKVSQIGSRKYCELLGFHSFPSFMNDSVREEDKIILFRKMVKLIEIEEKPEIIIIGTPGGILPINDKHHFDFGITNFMVSNAICPDCVVMNLLYNTLYEEDDLQRFREMCKHRFNYEISLFHVSNTFIDPSSLNDWKVKYIKIDQKPNDINVKNVYNFMAEDQCDEAFNVIVEQLAGNDFGQL